MQKTVSLTVNGKPVTATVEGRTLLVQLLREQLGLTGTHVGGDTSQCGAYVVHAEGDLCTRCTVRPPRADRMTCQHCADLQAAAYARAKIKRNVRRLLGEE